AIYKSFSTEVEARAFVENSGLSLSDFTTFDSMSFSLFIILFHLNIMKYVRGISIIKFAG
ncbi:hypothetical protein, partial [Prevotella histicola]|uniref:hypothetical protein n=1 Tax=Prevotella histicola TaxID=470565 RepID=UPI0036179502